MKTGDRVHVRHAGSPQAVSASVEHYATPADMPAIPGAPDPDQVRAILAEQDVQRLALISYRNGLRVLAFWAFQRPDGAWFDLRGQSLVITEPRQ